MADFQIVRWRELTQADRGAWAAFRDAQSSLRSPYFDLGWFDAVDRARGDLFVARGTRRSGAVAFLAFHPGVLGVARPAGGTFCDWHGFVAEPGLAVEAGRALSGGPAAFRFEASPAGDPGFAAHADDRDISHTLDLSAGFEAYARPAVRAAPKAIANLRRAQRKLEADGRRVSYEIDDRSPETLAWLMALKSAQYRRSRHPDALAWDWSRRLIAALPEATPEMFGGVVSSLKIDGELAAAHLGLRSGGVMHHWLPTYEPSFASYAPGNVLAVEIARAKAPDGVVEIDLGPGDYPWKREFASGGTELIRGLAYAASPIGRAAGALGAAGRRWATLPVGPVASLPARVIGRVERTAAQWAAAPA
ncbi:GNAT family N-acetyltransferase [Phenylobacterium sp.]|uniref:GNAT family N-acetyltransferase n=1 Tax=Phenylobacterium sp. TaxID=1871053 RepID=UPI00286B59BB|nr:GNAT family N-acetyltransferase [Phenylobacterium sp.]